MGLWSWFFPTPDDRVARARKQMEAERWADARLEVMGLDHPDVPDLLLACETELARMNLEAAISWAEAGDDDRVRHHMEVAENFRHDAIGPLFRDTRRALREARQERLLDAQRAAEAEQTRLLSTEGPLGSASWRDASMPAELFAGDDEAEARLALIVEGYTKELRKTVGDLGGTFARALIDFEDGRADLALQAYLTLPDDSAVVRYERARTAYAMDDPAAAARELRAFANLFGRHADMGRHHTGSLLALCLVQDKQPAEALRVMRSVIAAEPKQDRSLYAQLLEINGQLEEAEAVLVPLIRAHPKESSFYRMMARIQLTRGDRMKAMSVLERSLQANGCCTPGQCGYRPPDIGVLRTLSTLYLEDHIEVDRGLELAEQALGLVKQPTWEDHYLQALLARKTGSPDAARMAQSIWEITPPGDARHPKLTKYLAVGG